MGAGVKTDRANNSMHEVKKSRVQRKKKGYMNFTKSRVNQITESQFVTLYNGK